MPEEIKNTYDDNYVGAYRYVLDNSLEAVFWFERQRSRMASKRAQWRSVENCVALDTPFDETELEEQGLGYHSNVNLGELRSLIKPIKRAYNHTWDKVQNVIKTTLSIPVPESGGQIPQIPNNFFWEKVLEQCFSDTIRADKSIGTAIKLSHSFLPMYAHALFYRPEKSSYKMEIVHPTRVALPEYAKLDPSEWGTLAFVEHYNPQTLWDILMDLEEDVNSHPGWNKEALRYLMATVGGYSTQNGFDPLQDGDFFEFVETVTTVGSFGRFLSGQEIDVEVELGRIFEKQEDGTYSTALVMRQNLGSFDFIYKKEKVCNDLSEIVFLFTIDSDAEYFEDVFSPAEEIFTLADLVTRTDNKTITNIDWTGTLFIQSGNQLNQDTRNHDIVQGGINDIAAGSLQAGNFATDLQATSQSAELLRSQAFQKLGLHGYDPRQPDDRQGRDDFARITGEVLKDFLIHYYNQLDFFYAWVFKNLLKTKSGYDGYEYKKYFMETLEEKGFPMELITDTKKNRLTGLPKAIKVKASRILGSGSTIGDAGLGQRLLSLTGLLGPQGRKNISEMVILNEAGHEHYDTAIPPQDRQPIQDMTDREVSIDIEMAQRGMQMAAPIEIQDHLKHVTLKFEFLTQLKQAYEQDTEVGRQINPNSLENPILIVHKAFDATLRNAQAHMQYLERDPNFRTEGQELRIAFGELVNFASMLQKNAQSSLQGEVRQAEKLTEQERLEGRKDRIVEAQIRREDVKTQSEIARDNKVAIQKIVSEDNIKTLHARSKINNEKILADQKLAQETLSNKPRDE